MTSAVDATLPANNVKTSKADFRTQFLVIKNEITALQTRTGLPGAKAFYGFLDHQEVLNLIRQNRPNNLAADIAFGRVSLT
jgi:hypothetical protein|tara:strand:- start:1114 stop:1356 length:243 start_codon:yes stop_codon:yes gene_type:complete